MKLFRTAQLVEHRRTTFKPRCSRPDKFLSFDDFFNVSRLKEENEKKYIDLGERLGQRIKSFVTSLAEKNLHRAT